MNWLDLILTICVLVGIIKGMFDGFIKQAVSLAGLVLAILFAGLMASLIQPLAKSIGFIPEHLTYPLCYVLSFVIIIVVIAVAGRMLEKVWNLTPFGCLNNLAGGFTGMLTVTLSLSLILNFLVIFDRNSHIISEQSKHESVLFERVQAVVPTLYPYVKNKIREGYQNDRNEEEKIQEEAIEKSQKDEGVTEV